MTTYTFIIKEIDGEFFINDEQDGFLSREDAILEIKNHCDAELIKYVIKQKSPRL